RRVDAARADRDRRTTLRRQHHHPHDALSVHLEIVLPHADIGAKLPGELDELRGASRVQPVLVHDRDGPLGFAGSTHENTCTRNPAIATTARKMRAGMRAVGPANQPASAAAAGASSHSVVTRSAVDSPAAMSGSTAPSRNAAVVTTMPCHRATGTARSFSPTLRPPLNPMRSAHQRSAR